MQFADLHIHSKYSRATSPNMIIEELAKYAKIKGLNILGTGDFTHPLWLKEIRKKLAFVDGIYEYEGVRFVPSGEISLIYRQDGVGRRVHNVLLAPTFEVVDQINEFLLKKGRTDYDGRPIFGFSCIEMMDAFMSISKEIMVIPAHVWTPWFSLFGSMSGFDSIDECFAEHTKNIYALETGLSSDPPMNRMLSGLDRFTLVSNSDSHSPYPWRLGREANVFDLKKVDYSHLVDSIKTRRDFLFTIEVDPSYGKYHYDGHRDCNFSCAPEETKKLNGMCPVCGKKLIIGVLNRVEELADRKESKPDEFKSLLPLSELIAFVVGGEAFSKKANEVYDKFIARFGNEFHILLNVEKERLKDVNERVAEMVVKNRSGGIRVEPGYDGVYGKIIDSEMPKKTYDENKFNLKKFL
ncbi:MAG: endonuclease Q family protein [Candidatus Aenigmatarchaeota archaeon]